MYLCRIRVSEVNKALKRMKTGKTLGPYGISIEVWKCMWDNSLSWLTKLFNKIIRTKKNVRWVDEKYCGAYQQEQRGYSKLHQLSWDQAYKPYNETMGDSDWSLTKTWNLSIWKLVWIYAREINRWLKLFSYFGKWWKSIERRRKIFTWSLLTYKRHMIKYGERSFGGLWKRKGWQVDILT